MSNATDAAGPGEIEEALVAFFDAFRRSRAALQRAGDLGHLSLAEFSVLRAVADYGEGGVGRIAAAAGIAQPPATRALDRLARKALLARQRHPADGRVSAVWLTPAGEELLASHRRRLQHAAELIAARAGPGGTTQAAALLRALAQAFEDAAI
jgi:MarR family 2-MHQ and catechol resistance regulon transcriptional repressor